MADSLNPKQQAFVQQYLVDLNATQAAIRAGYSVESAESQGSRLLRNDKVQAAIAAGQAARAKRTNVSADRVLRELARLGFSDIGAAFDIDGDLLALKDIPAPTRRAIASYSVEHTDKGTFKTIKLWDKPKSLELLGKHLKLFTEKVEVSGHLSLEQLVAQSLEKVPADEEPGE